MKLLWVIGAVVVSVTMGFAQVSDLAQQHGLLAKDCKNIRGHAGRVVEEASQTELNCDVALAHAREAVKYLDGMEQRLQATKKMLSKDQLARVASHYAALEKGCSKMHDLCAKLQKQLTKDKPDRLEVKQLAMSLRKEMSGGYDVHEQMMKSLGLK